MLNNIIDKETLRNTQLKTLEILKDSLIKSFGPYGSNTIIYEGDNALPRYTKDGHTILKNIKFLTELSLELRSHSPEFLKKGCN